MQGTLFKMKTVEEIIEHDVKHHHDGVSLEDFLHRISTELKEGNARMAREGDTLIIFKAQPDKVCEFHCINADTASHLAENVLKFLKLAKEIGFAKAVTPYKNPAITHLIKKFFTGKYEFDIKETNVGFEAEVTL